MFKFKHRLHSPEDDGSAAPAGQPVATDQKPTDTLLGDKNPGDADKTAASGAGEGKPTPGDKAGEGDQRQTDTYADFAMPEGIELDQQLLSEAVPIFKELGLTKEQAQKLVDFQAKQVQAGSQKQIDSFNQQLDAWRDAAKTDSEFGGEKFDESIALARAAIGKFGTPELKQLLNDYGVGNHPEVIRFMVRVGKLTKEDVPGAQSNASTKPADRASLLYPNDKQA